jgi:mannose/fructose/N-acetylgalactosamine-specific phosphotransferase system component IID
MNETVGIKRRPGARLMIAFSLVALAAGIVTSVVSALYFKGAHDAYLREFLESVGGPLFALAAYAFVWTLDSKLRKNPFIWLVLIVITIGAVWDAFEFIVMLPDILRG